jgi:hypothetical protein
MALRAFVSGCKWLVRLDGSWRFHFHLRRNTNGTTTSARASQPRSSREVTEKEESVLWPWQLWLLRLRYLHGNGRIEVLVSSVAEKAAGAARGKWGRSFDTSFGPHGTFSQAVYVYPDWGSYNLKTKPGRW